MMNRIASAVVSVSALMFLAPAAANAQSGKNVEIHNMTNWVVTDLRVVSSNSRTDENNLLPTSYIYSGRTMNIEVFTRNYGCFYTIRARFTNGIVREVTNFDMCSYKHFDLTPGTINTIY